MSEFKKGQLVAARDNAGESWALVKYNHKADHKHSVERIAEAVLLAQNYNYKECLPAEEIWPDIFLGWERDAGEQAAEALAMEPARVQRLRRQIAWLCRQIMTNALHRKQSDFCPPLDMPTGPDGRCQRSCIACWEQASLKAVEDAKDE